MESNEESYIIDQFRDYVKRKQNERKRARMCEQLNEAKAREILIQQHNTKVQEQEQASPTRLLSPKKKDLSGGSGKKFISFADAMSERIDSNSYLDLKKEGVTDKVARIMTKTKKRLKLQRRLDDSKFEKKIQIFKNLDTFIDIREFIQDLNIVNYDNLEFLLEKLQLEKALLENNKEEAQKQKTNQTEEEEELKGDTEENEMRNEEDEMARKLKVKNALLRARELTGGGMKLPPRRSDMMGMLPSTMFEYLAFKELGGALSMPNDDEQVSSKFDVGLLQKIRRNFFSYKDKEEGIVLRAQKAGRYQTQMAHLENFFHKHLKNSKIAGGDESLQEKIAKGMYIQTYREHVQRVKNLLVLTTKHIFKSKENDIDKKFKAQTRVHEESEKIHALNNALNCTVLAPAGT